MPVRIHQQGERFYVPHFEVKIEGHNLPQDIVRDVIDVKYQDNVNEIDSFELTINNWDAAKHKFKYEPFSEPDFRGLFEPGKELDLIMGYLGNTRTMLHGFITTIEPNYAESSHPTLAVRGMNILHRFRFKQHTWAWENARDSDVAIEIGRRARTDDEPGIGLRVKAPAADSEDRQYIFMNNQYDIVFLLERARRRGYVIYVDRDAQGEFLFFGPPEEMRTVEYQLEWGFSLSSFRPTFTTANQISKVTVLGWDRQTRKPISESAELEKDCKVDPSLNSASVARAVHAEEVISDPPARTKDEAKRRAKDTLCNARRNIVKASGATVGLTDLRAGCKVHVVVEGSRFDGQYFVTATTHIINDSGYKTTFEARREEGQPAASSTAAA